MTGRLNAELAPAVIDERLRSARRHRSRRVRRYALPVVRQNPRPVGPDALDARAY
jgi:hypothetical protein